MNDQAMSEPVTSHFRIMIASNLAKGGSTVGAIFAIGYSQSG